MKQRNQIIALVVLFLIAAAVWMWNSRQGPGTAGAASVVSNYTPINIDNPAIQKWKIDKVRKTEYKTAGRNPFSSVAPPPPPPAQLKPGDRGYTPPPPPPPPPDPTLPANVKFYGYGTVPNGTERRAFLTDGEEVYVVAEGEVLLGRYRIIKIGNASLEFEETATGRHGRATLEDAALGAGPDT